MDEKFSAIKKYAGLLASEGIKVRFEVGVQPKFDTKSRTLTVPKFDMQNNVEFVISKMFIAHEVGHALFTSSNIVEEQIERIKPIHTYVNVLEDIRVERKMKKLYKGLSVQFYDGYKAFAENVLSNSVKERVLDENLISRINTFAKFGEFIEDIPFSEEEKEILDEAYKTETLIDVINLAEKIYAMDDSKIQEQSDEYEDGEDGDEDDEDEDEDGDSNDSSDSKKPKSKKSKSKNKDKEDSDSSEDEKEDGDEDDEDDSNDSSDSKKSKSTKAKKSSSSKSKPNGTQKDGSGKMEEESIVTKIMDDMFKEMSERADNSKESFENVDTEEFRESLIKEIDLDDFLIQKKSLMRENSCLIEPSVLEEVNISTQQFNMFKDARRRLNTRKYKSGDLDVDLLFKHKLSDDIFRTTEIRYREENHGFVFLLDYSGSMKRTIEDVMYQLFVLCLFAKRNKIPFEVYCFCIPKTKSEQYLAKIFSSDLTEPELKKRYNDIFNIINDSGSTPLVESCGMMLKHLEEFKSRNKNRKLSYIILSDGGEDGYALSDNLIYKGKEYDNNIHDQNYITFVDISKDIGYNTIGYFLIENEDVIKTNSDRYLSYLGTNREESTVLFESKSLLKVKPNNGFDSAFLIARSQTKHDKKVFLQHFIKEMS